jgi:hypothetical protein
MLAPVLSVITNATNTSPVTHPVGVVTVTLVAAFWLACEELRINGAI